MCAEVAILTHGIYDLYCRNVLRWGKNIGSAKTRTKKRAGAAVYNRASSLETLVCSMLLCVLHVMLVSVKLHIHLFWALLYINLPVQRGS